MTLRPALRAALVVSGLSLPAGCGGTAVLHEHTTTPTSNDATTNEGTTSEGTTSDASTDGSSTNVDARAACDPGAEPTTAACCNQQGGRQWDAASGTCVWVAVPGPFVPPAMLG